MDENKQKQKRIFNAANFFLIKYTNLNFFCFTIICDYFQICDCDCDYFWSLRSIIAIDYFGQNWLRLCDYCDAINRSSSSLLIYTFLRP